MLEPLAIAEEIVKTLDMKKGSNIKLLHVTEKTVLADYFVMQGVPFRKAHHCVGEIVALAEKTKTPINELADEDIFAICDKANKDWRKVFDLKRAFAMRENIGMPGVKQIDMQIKAWKEFLGR